MSDQEEYLRWLSDYLSVDPQSRDVDAIGWSAFQRGTAWAARQQGALMAEHLAKNHKTWNDAMERAAQMAEAYAELYKSQAAKRIAEDCRACRLPLPEPSTLGHSDA